MVESGSVVGGYALRWGSATHAGNRRTLNEDAVLAVPGVFVVADGMGGHAAGELASAMVVERFAELTTSGSPPVRIGEVATILDEANDEIRRYGASTGRGPMGTTVVGLVIALGERGAVPLVFHVGDSRAYRRAGGLLHPITRDHSEVQELIDAGLLDPEEARHHPQRNVITRSLGVELTVAVDFSVLDAAPMRVLLCSDGLVNEVTDDDLATELASAEHPALVADRLLARALGGEARDNVTAVVVDLQPVDDPLEADITTPRDARRTGWAPRPATPLPPPELPA